jgi:hypothetical protein
LGGDLYFQGSLAVDLGGDLYFQGSLAAVLRRISHSLGSLAAYFEGFRIFSVDLIRFDYA